MVRCCAVVDPSQQFFLDFLICINLSEVQLNIKNDRMITIVSLRLQIFNWTSDKLTQISKLHHNRTSMCIVGSVIESR